MKNNLITKVFNAGHRAAKTLGAMSPKDKAKLEETWDVEHAYYSSALEGSKLDKKEFEALAKETK